MLLEEKNVDLRFDTPKQLQTEQELQDLLERSTVPYNTGGAHTTNLKSEFLQHFRSHLLHGQPISTLIGFSLENSATNELNVNDLPCVILLHTALFSPDLSINQRTALISLVCATSVTTNLRQQGRGRLC